MDIHQRGIFLGTLPAAKFDWERSKNIIKKFVRGLYYHHHTICLGNNVDFDIFCINHQVSEHGMKEFLAQPFMEPIFKNLITVNLGQGTVRYGYKIASDNPKYSYWMFNFYGNYLHYVCFVKPKASATEAKQLEIDKH